MYNLKSLNCPTCNAPLTITGNEAEVRCQFCGNIVIVPPELRNNAASTVGQTPAGSSSFSTGIRPLTLIIVVAGITIALIAVVFGITQNGVPKFTVAPPTISPIGPTTTPPISVVVAYGGSGSGVGLFSDPTELAVDGKGYAYVSDRDTGLIQRFDPDGHYLSQWQVDPKAAYGAVCLAADHNGNVFACDAGIKGFLKFDGATGKILGSFIGNQPGLEFSSSAAALLDGSILAYETNSDEIFKLDPNGNIVNRTDKIGTHLPSHTTTFNVQIAVDGLGNSFVLETSTGYVMAYKPDGTFINRFGGRGDDSDQVGNAQTIAIDNQSRIYIINLDVLKVFDHDGHYLISYPLPSEMNRVSDFELRFDDANNLYVLGNNKKIYKLKIKTPS